jgi:LysR family hydrogen peroxide-inducible transcriptional activator
MNLRDLHYLVAVAELRHFGKAADACFISQPTLSAQIKKLENYLNVQLIERTPKKIIMTPAGKAIVEKAKMILQNVNDIKDIAHYASDPEAGTLRIGLIPTLAPYLLPHIIPLLKLRFPKLELFLYEEKTKSILKKLKEGSLDAVILALPVENEGLTETALFNEKFFVALPKNHRFSNKKSLKIADLNDEKVLLLEEGHCLRQQALEICSNMNMQKNSDFSATSLETLRQMVASGAGITLLPELAANVQIANQDAIVIKHFAEPQPSRQIGMLWRKSSVLSDLMEKIAVMIQKNIVLPLVA